MVLKSKPITGYGPWWVSAAAATGGLWTAAARPTADENGGHFTFAIRHRERSRSADEQLVSAAACLAKVSAWGLGRQDAYYAQFLDEIGPTTNIAGTIKILN